MARKIKEEEYAGKRNEILSVARRLVYTKGYEQMSIQDILGEMQISKGAFYHYFDSKQDLLEAMIDGLVTEGEELFTPILKDPELPALEKLQRYFLTASRWKTANKEFIVALMRVWYTDENAIVRQKLFSAMSDSLGPVLSSVVEQGNREGTFSSRYPEQVGEMIVGVAQGMSDSIIRLMVSPTHGEDIAQKLINYMHAYMDAMERILGAQPGTLDVFDPELIEEWFPPLEKTFNGVNALPEREPIPPPAQP